MRNDASWHRQLTLQSEVSTSSTRKVGTFSSAGAFKRGLRTTSRSTPYYIPLVCIACSLQMTRSNKRRKRLACQYTLVVWYSVLIPTVVVLSSERCATNSEFGGRPWRLTMMLMLVGCQSRLKHDGSACALSVTKFRLLITRHIPYRAPCHWCSRYVPTLGHQRFLGWRCTRLCSPENDRRISSVDSLARWILPSPAAT